MNEHINPAERRPGEYILFAGAFAGFGIGATGVLLATVPVAVTGALILLFVFSCFGLGSAE